MSDQLNEVLRQLEPLRSVPARSDAAARSGLDAFLNEAIQHRPAVSAPAPARPTGWKSFFKPARLPMHRLAKIMLIVSVMIGGAGATTVAAQSSLPGDGLYPIKLMVEDARVALTADPQAQIDLRLELAQVRTQEMQQLVAQQRAVPDDAAAQVQTQLQAALNIAAQFDDAPLEVAMQQIEMRIMAQTRALAQTRSNAPDDSGLRRAEQVLNQMQAMAQLGQSDPGAFRGRFGPGRPIEPPAPAHTPVHTPVMTHTVLPAHTPQPSRTPQATRTLQGTSAPQGNGYGPGPQVTPNQGATTQPVVTPIGNGDGHEFGPGPQATPAPQATPSGGGGSPEQTPEPGGSGSGSGSGGGGGGPR
jgi:hypothetical protein